MSEAFRTEIIENQKARIDLIKWKLVIVAAVFGWCLQKGGNQSEQLSFWAISLVPFVCLFVDSQCFHINLRTLVIGQFLRLYKPKFRDKPEPSDQSDYEVFVHNLRTGQGLKNIFELEQGVLTYSTIFLCIGVMLWPSVSPSVAPIFSPDVHSAPKEYGKYACWVCGSVGLIFSVLLKNRYEKLKSNLTGSKPEQDSQPSNKS